MTALKIISAARITLIVSRRAVGSARTPAPGRDAVTDEHGMVTIQAEDVGAGIDLSQALGEHLD